ncbi:MAG TPA: hypothetical protein VFB43_09475 [Terracidiphilus sp.]|nr:hypothetical protein [Terracidiphilus sp.]
MKEPVRDETQRSTEELEMLRARQQNLLALIAELLETNEKLRMRVAQLEARSLEVQMESGREPVG